MSSQQPAGTATRSILFALFALLCLGGCGRKNFVHRHKTPAETEQATKAVDGSPIWNAEPEYIIGSIATDLAKMAYFAKFRKGVDEKNFSVEVNEQSRTPEQTSPIYRVKVQFPSQPEIETNLTITQAIWSSAVYHDFLAFLLSKLEVPLPATTDSEEAPEIQALTDLRATSIERENLKLSSQIEDHFTSPDLHDRAALIVCAFALREHAGDFFDSRAELNRITAHLTFAEVLRGNGKVPQVHELVTAALSTFCNAEVDALEKLAKIPPSDPATAAWLKSLVAVNTGDYRTWTDNDHPTEMEKWARLNALAVSIGSGKADDSITEADHEGPEWSRILNAHSPSISLGHDILEHALGAEVHEFHAIYTLLGHGTESETEAIAALNAEPESSCIETDAKGVAHVSILGWGHWAGFFQRHLCHAVASNFDFIERRWNVPEKAQQYRDAMDKNFNDLRLYPFVRRMNATEAAYYRKAQEDALAVAQKQPHLVPTRAWNYLHYAVSFCEFYLPVSIDTLDAWYKYPFALGTAYDMRSRLGQKALFTHPEAIDILQQLHQVAPFDPDIAFSLLMFRSRHDSRNPTAQELEEVYKPVLDFSADANVRVARSHKKYPDVFAKWMRRAAEIEPTNYFELGYYLRNHLKDDEAAAAYELAMTKCTDVVWRANQADWLVQYWEAHGFSDKATALAEMAARTYSARGLEAKVHLLEKRHDYDEAYEYQKKEYERYEDRDEMVAFLRRYENATGDRRHREELDQLVHAMMPANPKKIDADTLTRPPKNGVVLLEESAETEKAGLKKGDVIVAVRGIECPTFHMYALVCNSEMTPFLLHVWRAGHYFQVTASPPNNIFGVSMDDYSR